jgi:hypothetical protein
MSGGAGEVSYLRQYLRVGYVIYKALLLQKIRRWRQAMMDFMK